ncbi:hypothetical protein L6252_01415 [Candidatus Parcubacteria bacterium]|nr:hypothetical protein [Candidatus Parcubacteria bacterium]
MFNQKNILVFVGVALLIFIGALASDSWNPSWDPFLASGNVVERALTKTLKAKALSVDLLVKLAADLEGVEGNQTMSVEVDLKENISLKEDLSKAKGMLDILVLTEGASLSTNLENILDNNGFYLKLNTLPSVLPLGIDLSSFKGKWFSVDLAMLKQALSQPETEALSKEQRDQLLKEALNVLEENPIFIIKETKEDSFIVEIDKEGLKKLAPAFLESMKKYIDPQNLQTYQSSIDKALANFPQQVDDFWQETGGIEFEVWLDKGYLSKVKWQKVIDVSKGLTPEIESKIKGGNIDLTIEIVLSNFNKSFDIQAPADSTPLEEILMPLLSGVSGIMPGDFSQFDMSGLENLEGLNDLTE